MNHVRSIIGLTLLVGAAGIPVLATSAGSEMRSLVDAVDAVWNWPVLAVPVGVFLAGLLVSGILPIARRTVLNMLILLMVATTALGLSAAKRENRHDFATSLPDGRDLQLLAEESPQWRAQTTYATFLRLADTLKDATVALPPLDKVDVYRLFQRRDGEVIDSPADFDPFIDYVDGAELLALLESFARTRVMVIDYDWEALPESTERLALTDRGGIGMAGGRVLMHGESTHYRLYTDRQNLFFLTGP